MKRTILVLLAMFALAVVAVVATQAVEIDGAPRLLLIAGAVVLLVGVVDGLRRPSLDTAPSDQKVEAIVADFEPTPVAPGLAETIIDLREPPTTIDLRDGKNPADRSDEPGALSDDEVHTMIMVAVSQGALADARPRLHAVPDEPRPFRALAS